VRPQTGPKLGQTVWALFVAARRHWAGVVWALLDPGRSSTTDPATARQSGAFYAMGVNLDAGGV